MPNTSRVNSKRRSTISYSATLTTSVATSTTAYFVHGDQDYPITKYAITMIAVWCRM